MKKCVALILSCIGFVSANAETIDLNKVPKCTPSLSESQVCYINSLKNIRAAQFNFGEQYVNNWVATNLIMKPSEYQAKVLDTTFFPIIVAPDGVMFLADGHHRLRATEKLSNLQHHQYKIYLQVFKKFPQSNSKAAESDFWSWMYSTKNVWLEDEGVYKDKKYLPTSILHTTNDKYRTLAGWLMESGWCYNAKEENNVNYIEFYWADYFRNLANKNKLKAYPDPDISTVKGKKVEQEYLQYIKQSELCHAPAAESLPAYCKTDDCTK